MDNIENNMVSKRLIEKGHREKNSFLDSYAEQAINKEASLFLGSGVSSNSGYLTWGTLFEPLAEELGIVIDKNSDLYAIAQYYANKYSDATLRKKVNSKINQIKSGNEILSELIDINFSSIWTTNYDPLIEQELTSRLIPHNVIHNEKNLASIDRHDKVSIYKLNGDVTDPVNMIITKNDYEHYLDSHELFLTFLKRELIAQTFLFVGYSFSDALILDCLTSINKLLGPSSNTHYAIMVVGENANSDFEHAIEDLEKRYNIKCICTTKTGIYPLLKQLNIRIREKKVFISGSYDTLSQTNIDEADSLSYSLVTSLLKSDYRISTGIGKRLGTFVTGYAHQYLAENAIQNKEKYLSMRPFPFHLELSDETKNKYRTLMQQDCSAAIFLYGQSKSSADSGRADENGHYSSGVYQEFKIAKERGMTIIPVGSTGFEAEIIWNEVKKEINRYFYLSNKVDILMYEKDPQKISQVIISILSDIAQHRRINQ